jgi:uncharacterized YigZ family protein
MRSRAEKNMQKRKTFRTITAPTEGEYIEKKSKFLAYAFPADNEKTIKQHLEEIKKLHPKSRHICYAYRLGPNGDIYKVNDAGEPSNSAGQPILGQIKSFELTNVLVVVARYFGGTKLGIGGLVSAYKLAAHEALQKAGIIDDFEKEEMVLETSYNKLNDLLNFIKNAGVPLLNQEFSGNCIVHIGVPKDEKTAFLQSLKSKPFIHLVTQ